jgi:hypothetical protein
LEDTVSLAQALGFSPSDLAANQRNQLSEGQVARVNGQYGSGGLMILAAVVMIFLGFLRLFTRGTDGLPLLEILLLGGGLFIGFGGWLVINRTNHDLRDGSVATISGVAARQIVEIRFSKSYLIKISNMDFSVSRDVYEAFVEGHDYQVFYTPRTRILLSAVESQNEPDDVP